MRGLYVDIWGLYVDLRGLYVEHLRAICRNGGRYVKINTKNEKLYPKTSKPSISIYFSVIQKLLITNMPWYSRNVLEKYYN